MGEVKKGGIKPKAKGKKRKAKIDEFDDLDKSTQKNYPKSILASLVAGASTPSSTTSTITSLPALRFCLCQIPLSSCFAPPCCQLRCLRVASSPYPSKPLSPTSPYSWALS